MLIENKYPVNLHMRITSLDGLRGIAAFIVFVGHFILAFGYDTSPLLLSIKDSPLHIFYDGAASVDLFFLLSGLVLAMPYVNNKKDLDVVPFWIARLFRIYPVFIVTILCCFFYKTFFHNPAKISDYSGWLRSFWMWDSKANFGEVVKTLMLVGPRFDTRLLNPVIWSLIIEFQVSVILPVFIFFAMRNQVAVTILLAVIAITFTHYHFLAVFILGVLMAKYKDRILQFINLNNGFALYGGLSLGILLYTSRYTFGFFHLNIAGYLIDYLTALGAAIFIVLAIGNGAMIRLLNSKYIQHMGRLSYSFYLIHFLILMVICSLVSRANVFAGPLVFIGTLAITYFLSFYAYKYIEEPSISMGKKIGKYANSKTALIFPLKFRQ